LRLNERGAEIGDEATEPGLRCLALSASSSASMKCITEKPLKVNNIVTIFYQHAARKKKLLQVIEMEHTCVCTLREKTERRRRS
jgi:hypothetical protein